LVFVNACEDSIMVDYVITPSNPLAVPLENEELENNRLT
jgi:hypothetical protein